MKKIFLFFCLMGMAVACCNNSKESSQAVVTRNDFLGNTKVITKAEQDRLTPQKVLDMLKEGNKIYADDKLTIRNTTQRIKDAAKGQYPKAVVLSCLDSRVPVEDVFNQGIGDLFVARVAGNINNPDMLGSMEFACNVSGSKLILVLGHDYCGAVAAAINDVELGNITGLLSRIKPAVASASASFTGEKSASNPKFMDAVCLHNVKHVINDIRLNSPILKGMEEKGEIMIVGAVYNLETGKVDFL